MENFIKYLSQNNNSDSIIIHNISNIILKNRGRTNLAHIECISFFELILEHNFPRATSIIKNFDSEEKRFFYMTINNAIYSNQKLPISGAAMEVVKECILFLSKYNTVLNNQDSVAFLKL